MGVALHWRVFATALPAPAAIIGIRFRVVVLGSPKTAWRSSSDEAMADAIDMGLASWDASMGAHYLAVPVEMEIDLGDRRP